MADVPSSVFERLQAREARADVRRQAVRRWVSIVVLLLSWLMMLALAAPAIFSLVREKPWADGQWMHHLRQTPLATTTRWIGSAGWIFFMIHNTRLFFRRRDQLASKLDVVLIVIALSCWTAKLYLDRELPWMIGLIPALFVLSWSGRRVWPYAQHKFG